MRQYLVFYFLIVYSSVCLTQEKSFFNLSGPKKTWVIFHPLKAEKAYKISLEANHITDSIAKTNLLDGDKNGGEVDAFRHAYWMARLHQEIGKSAARSLGKAHEQENYLMYKERQLEDEVLPDEPSSLMDLWNNEIGLSLVNNDSKVSKQGVIFRVVNAIKQGKLKMLKKNKKGQYVTCEDKVITITELKSKWKTDKCLVPSNYEKPL